MIPSNIVDNLVIHFQQARQAAENRRGPPTAANGGDLIQLLEADLMDYQQNAHSWARHIRNIYAHMLYKRMLLVIRPAWPIAHVPVVLPYNPRLFANAEVNLFIQDFYHWRSNINPQPFQLKFGQMRVNQAFQGVLNLAAIGQNAREAALNAQLLTTVTATQLGYGLGCRVTIFLYNGQYIVSNNRTYTAHCLANTRPLRLVIREPQAAEINRLAEVEGQNGVPGFNFLPGVNRPLGAPNPRVLPSDWMPIENNNNPAQVNRIAIVPHLWSNP